MHEKKETRDRRDGIGRMEGMEDGQRNVDVDIDVEMERNGWSLESNIREFSPAGVIQERDTYIESVNS